jgi:hypothetical protein
MKKLIIVNSEKECSECQKFLFDNNYHWSNGKNGKSIINFTKYPIILTINYNKSKLNEISFIQINSLKDDDLFHIEEWITIQRKNKINRLKKLPQIF